MKKRTKNFLIVLCVIAGVIIAASIILRIVLTKERLTAMIVPRIEQRTGAEIEFRDIGIRFPFGFGVRLYDLRLSKEIPPGGKMELTAGTMTADASLMSLLRRKPEIKSVTVGEASLDVDIAAQGVSVKARGLGARLSMQTSEKSYLLDPSVSVEKITLTRAGTGQSIVLPPLDFSAGLEVDIDLSKAVVSDGKLAIADLADLKIEGEVADPRGEGRYRFTAKSSGLDAKRLADTAMELGLAGAAQGSGEPGAAAAFSVEGGLIGLDAVVQGMISAPSDLSVAGSLGLEGIALNVPGVPALAASGKIEFTDSTVASKDMAVEAGSSKMNAAFTVDMDRREKKPRYVRFDLQSKIDLQDLSGLMPAAEAQKEPLKGILKASFKGGAGPAVLKDLFPPKGGGTTPERIAKAWKEIDLEGALDLSSVELPDQKGPARITALAATSSISGGSVKSLSAEFKMGGRPWKVTGEMKDVMPAMAELALLAGKEGRPAAPGPMLDAMSITPDMSIYVKGRAFDSRPYQKDKAAADAGGGYAPAAAKPNPLAANPLTLLALKKTFISVSVDSIISKGAVLTALDAKGRISDGVLSASPVTVDYAGGKGSGKLLADLRDPSKIKSDVDIDFSGIDAGKALSGFGSIGSLVSGSFSMKLAGRFTAGPGMDILKNLTATGRATSSSGTIDLSQFMAPIKATGLSLSSLERFDFHEWTEKFVIDKGRVSSETWNIRSKSGDWDIAGSFGFDGTLDYKAALTITPAQQARVKDLAKYGSILDLFRDDAGNVLLMLDVGGTAKQPKVRLDQSKAKEKAKNELIDGAKDKLKDLFKR